MDNTEKDRQKQNAEAATGLRLYWRNEVTYGAGSTATVTSFPIFAREQPTDEEGVHYTATKTEAEEWRKAARFRLSSTSALRCTDEELDLYARACEEIAAKRPAAAAYSVNFEETARHGRVFVDIWNYV